MHMFTVDDEGRPVSNPRPSSPEIVINQFELVIEPSTGTRSWKASRIGIYKDKTQASVLYVLSIEKYGLYDTREWMAYWRDGNWRNESYDNIALAERGIARVKPNKIGVPGGTKEYHRLYRAAHPEKVKAWHKASRQRIALARKADQEELHRLRAAADKLAQDQIAKLLQSPVLPNLPVTAPPRALPGDLPSTHELEHINTLLKGSPS